jgi:hypothetical protein
MEYHSSVFNLEALSGKRHPAASQQEETVQAQSEPSLLEEADDPDRSFSEVQEVDLSKLHNVAILIIEAQWA